MPTDTPKKRKRRKKPKGTVLQGHHPVADNTRSPFDEKFKIKLRQAQHQSLWRTVQRLKNTVENLGFIRNFIDALYAEYLLRYRRLKIEGEITDEDLFPQCPICPHRQGGKNDGNG